MIDINSINEISGSQKIAILLMAIDEENAKKIMSLFDDEELYKISKAMLELGYVKPDVVERIVLEFMQKVNSSTGVVGNQKIAKKFLSESLGEEKASALMSAAKRRINNNIWARLEAMPAYDVLGIVKKEHPQTVAIILSHITPNKAAEIFSFFNRDYAIEVIHRMLALDKTNSEKISKLEDALSIEIGDRDSENGTDGRSEYANFRVIADIFDNFTGTPQENIISTLNELAPQESEEIKKMMFSFQDIKKLDHNSIQKIILEVDKVMLATALKGVDESTMSLFLDRVSQRAARILVENIDRISATQIEIKKAQFDVVKIVKKMIRSGDAKLLA